MTALLVRLNRGMGWIFVRSIGELHLLTKASYVMLAFVPVLASLWWFVIRDFIDDYNKYLDRSATMFEEKAQNLRRVASDFEKMLKSVNKDEPPLLVGQLVTRISNEIEQSNRLSNAAQNLTFDLQRHHMSSNMPSVWVWAFLAALGAAVGHAVYQTSAPDMIKRYSLSEYQSEKRNECLASKASDIHSYALTLLRVSMADNRTDVNKNLARCINIFVVAYLHIERTVTNKFLDILDVI